MQEQSTDYTKFAIGAMVIMGIFVVGLAIRQKNQRRAFLEKSIKARLDNEAAEKKEAEQARIRRELRASEVQEHSVAPLPPTAPVAAAKPAPNAENISIADFKAKLEEKSNVALNAFQKTAYLKFQPPHAMQFREFEGFDNMAGIYGTNHLENTAALALGYPKKVTPEEGTKFLKEYANQFPHMRDANLKDLGPGTPLPPPAGDSGLSGGTAWAGKLKNNMEFHAVMLPRADGLGTYLMIMTGPPSYFKSTDFEDSYNNLKAVAPPTQK